MLVFSLIHLFIIQKSLITKKGTCELVSVGSKISPFPESHVITPIDLNITWLLNSVDQNNLSLFSIDKNNKNCKTPRRNNEVQNAVDFYRSCYSWCQQVLSS